MVTKIGKYLLFYILIFSLNNIFGESIILRLLSNNKVPLKSVGVGIPFILEVILKDVQKNEQPKIEGLDKFDILNKYSSQNITIINGNKSVEYKYTYTLRSKDVGIKIIGPVMIENSQLISNKIEFEVSDNQFKSENLTESVDLVLQIDSKDIYLGQKVPFKIKFSYAIDGLNLKQIERPQADGIKIIDIDNGKSQSLKNDDKIFNVIEFNGTFYANKSGKISISPIKAIYTIESTNKDEDDLSAFFGFLNVRQKKEEIYSNNIILDVKDLPKTDLEVNAIGQFKNFTTTIDKNKAKEGDAILLTLSVDCVDCDLDQIKTPKLNLPKEIKYYESKNYIENKNNNLVKKFEFILQGIKSGSYKIDSQSFVYFDLNTKDYKILKSNLLDLFIEESGLIKNKEKQEGSKELEISNLENKVNNIENNIDKEIIQLNQKNNFYQIDWILFIILTLLPIIFLLFKYLYEILKLRFFAKLNKKRIFYDLENRIKRHEKNLDTQKIYQEFDSCFFELSPDKSINDFLKEEFKFDQNMLDSWNIFYNKLLAFSGFAPKINQNKEHEKELFKESYKYINIFKDRFKSIKFNIIILFILFNCYSFCTSEIDNIVKLRKIQQYSRGQDYIKSEQIVNNIKENLGISLETRFSNYFNILYYCVSFINLFIWQISFLLLLYTLFFLWFFSPKKLNKNIIFSILFFILLTVFPIIVYAYKLNFSWAVVNKNEAVLLVGHDISYPIKGHLNYLSDVVILRRYNNWFYVKSNIYSGWISSDDLELI